MALACILVLKYRKGDDDSLMEKISKLNIHSIIKKSNRVSSHLKHLTGFAPQVSSVLAACLAALQALGTAAAMAWHRNLLSVSLVLPVNGDKALQLPSCL